MIRFEVLAKDKSVIAEGCTFSNGMTAVHTLADEPPSTTIWQTYEEVAAQDGVTIRMIDHDDPADVQDDDPAKPARKRAG